MLSYLYIVYFSHLIILFYHFLSSSHFHTGYGGYGDERGGHGGGHSGGGGYDRQY